MYRYVNYIVCLIATTFTLHQAVHPQQIKGVLLDYDNRSDYAHESLYTDSALNNIMLWVHSNQYLKHNGYYTIQGVDLVKVTDKGEVLKRVPILNSDYNIPYHKVLKFTLEEKYLRISAFHYTGASNPLELLYTFDDDFNIIKTDTFKNNGLLKGPAVRTEKSSSIKTNTGWMESITLQYHDSISGWKQYIYLLNYDSNLTLLNTIPYTKNWAYWSHPIILDDGNLLFLGSIGENITRVFPPNGDPSYLTGHTHRLGLLKTTPTGGTIWYKEFDEPTYNLPIDKNNGPTRLGGTFATNMIRLNNGNIAIAGTMDRSAFLMTIKQNGEVIWCRKMDPQFITNDRWTELVGTPYTSSGFGAMSSELNGMVEKNGSIYVTGSKYEYMAADSSLMTGYPIPRLYKFNLNGDLLWTRRYYYHYNSFAFINRVNLKADSLLFIGACLDSLKAERKLDIWFVKTDTNGCLVADCNKNDVICPYTSVKNELGFTDYNFTIYPNPAHSQLSIESRDFKEINSIIIFNQQGQVVKEPSVNFISNKMNIDVNELPPGKYYIELTGNKFRTVNQLIIK